MKLNMYILSDGLAKFKTQTRIEEGISEISGIRFYSGELTGISNDYVYVGRGSDVFDGKHYDDTVLLLNGHDMILVYDQTLETVLNEILRCFDFYNSWEATLLEAVFTIDGIQIIIDLCVDVLKAYVGISDLSGNVIAINSVEHNELSDEGWEQTIETKIIPLSSLSQPMFDNNGKSMQDWTTEPRLFYTYNGIGCIGAYVQVDEENVAIIAVQELKKKLTTGDCHILSVACSAIRTAIKSRDDIRIQSSTSAITNLIQGNLTDNFISIMTNKTNTYAIHAPWIIISIRNTASNYLETAKSRLCSLLRDFKISNMSITYNNDVLVLISSENKEVFLEELNKLILKNYFAVGISLPFSFFEDLSSRYRQASFAIDSGSGEAGVFDSKNLAFSYLLGRVKEDNRELEFIHPVIEVLKNYDTKKGTDLYKTLITYLNNERNVTTTAKELFIHRNTLSSRLEKINELIYCNLDDPLERTYIILAHLVNIEE